MTIRICLLSFLISATAWGRHRNFELNQPEPQETLIIDSSMLMLSMYKPTFSDLKYYDKFYKDTGFGLAIHSGRYLLDTSVYSLGVGMGLASYHDTGMQQKTASGKAPTSASELSEVEGGDLSLNLVSYQFFILNKIGIPGFDYIDLNVLIGYEELMFEEVRSLGTTSTSTTPTTTSTTTAKSTAATAVASSDKPIVNRGWHSNLNLNVSVNFLMNWLDEASVRSLEQSQGFSKVYFSPFINITNKLSNKIPFNRESKSASFAHTSYGIAFLFETE